MYSIMAALRTLTLPYGSTTGTRIVLDGVNGAILFYDASDNLVIDQESSTSTIAVGGSQAIVLDGSNNGFFIYNGTPANGTLIGSWATAAGTDAYGNTFPTGINVDQGQLTGVGLESATLVNAVLTQAAMSDSTITGPTVQGGTITEAVLSIDETSGAIFVYENSTTTDTYTSNDTWTAPAGIYTATVECWGAGGGGAGGETSHGGGGGGGGEYAREDNYVVTPGADYDVIVGVGGGGGTSSDTAGTDGGDTTFDGAGVIAHGGDGASGYPHGDGGTGSTNSVHYDGGTGVTSGDTSGGGAGSSAGTAAAGDDGVSTAGGTAPAGGGDGGDGTAVSGASGSDGSAPGGGGGGAAEKNAFTSYTYTYNPVHTYSYYGSGVGGGLRNTDGSMYQGSPNTSLSTYPGDQVSYALYDYATMHSDISGKTIDQVTLKLVNLHSWYYSGMTVLLGYSTSTSFGSTIPGSGNNRNVKSFSIGKGATLTTDITAAFSAVMASLTAFMLGWTTTTNPTYYGYFQGGTSGPQLKITCHSGASVPNHGGAGADGQVKVTYVSGLTLVGSWAPAAGTDPYANAYPAGLSVANAEVTGTLDVTGVATFGDEVELENGLNAMSGTLNSETQKILSGTSVPTTNGSGVWTINTGLTTVRGFVAWNGDCAARPNMVIGNNRTGWPASGSTIYGTAYVGSTGATINSTAVRIDWIAFGVA